MTEETDQIYAMLATQGATLAKVYDTIHNFQSMSWLLISSQAFVSNKRINGFEKWLEKESLEFLEKKSTNTNLFICFAICIHILKNHGKIISDNLSKAVSLVVDQLEKDTRLRTSEMVGNILFFLSKSNMFEKQVAPLKTYLRKELGEAIKAKSCATIIDCCFGLLPLEQDFDLHIFNECLENIRLLDIDRIAKALIILSLHKNDLKENYFSYLRRKLEEEYVSKLSRILQALINGISFVESDLPVEETEKAFQELKENEWTDAIEIKDKEIRLKRLSPSFLSVLNSKTIGLSLLSFEIAKKETRVSLYPDEFKKYQDAWKEKKFGFGVDKKQLNYLHYFSLILILAILFIGLLLSNFHGIIWKDIKDVSLSGFEIGPLLSLSIYSLVIIFLLGIIITYHRTFRRIIEKGKISASEIPLLIPIVGSIIKKVRGEES